MRDNVRVRCNTAEETTESYIIELRVIYHANFQFAFVLVED